MYDPSATCRYDDNGDGVLDLSEFTALIRAVDKTADDSDILSMYSRALDLTGEGDRISKVPRHSCSKLISCLLSLSETKTFLIVLALFDTLLPAHSNK